MKLFYQLCWFGVRATAWLMGGLEIRRVGNVPMEGGLILAVNHASYLDPPAVACAMPREISFMARRSLFKNWLFRRLIVKLNAFPVDRDGDSREALREFGRRLEEGRVVLMFPEGTRTRTGTLAEFEPGVATIALRSGVPILPVYVWGTYHSWPRNRKWPARHRMKVLFGEPIEVPQGLKGAARKQEQARIAGEVEGRLHALEKEAWDGEAAPVPLQITSSPEETDPTSPADAS